MVVDMAFFDKLFIALLTVHFGAWTYGIIVAKRRGKI
jgi:hypothetical protein